MLKEKSEKEKTGNLYAQLQREFNQKAIQYTALRNRTTDGDISNNI